MHLLAQLNVSPLTAYIGSVTAIITTTTAIVNFLVSRIQSNKGLGKVPTWVWAAAIAGLLTVAGNKLGTLPGNLWQLLGVVFIQTIGAGGLARLLKTGNQSIANTTSIGSSMPPKGPQ